MVHIPIASDDQNDSGVADTLLKEVTRGESFYKVKGCNRFLKREYRLDPEKLRLYYLPTRKPWARVCGTSAYVDLADAVEVRRGWNTDRFKLIEAKVRKRFHSHKPYPASVQEERCFSIIFENKSKTVDLIAPSKDIRDIWMRQLTHFLDGVKCAQTQSSFEESIRQEFKKTCEGRSPQVLTLKESATLISKSLNVSLESKFIKEKFKVIVMLYVRV